MSRWFGKAVVFCERCGEVCDRTCRFDALRERTIVTHLAVRTWPW